VKKTKDRIQNKREDEKTLKRYISKHTGLRREAEEREINPRSEMRKRNIGVIKIGHYI
jgi:hypothetical protein